MSEQLRMNERTSWIEQVILSESYLGGVDSTSPNVLYRGVKVSDSPFLVIDTSHLTDDDVARLRKEFEDLFRGSLAEPHPEGYDFDLED